MVSIAVFIAFSLGSLEARIGTLITEDFNGTLETGPNSWPATAKKASETGMMTGPFGTPDSADNAEPSGGLRLLVTSAERGPWHETLRSGPLAISNPETGLAKLTLAFDLCASRALPVRVRIESFDDAHVRTGGLVTTIHPAAENFYQRHALELSTFRPDGEGVFSPTAPFVDLNFEIGADLGWPSATRHELRLDNVHYARAAFFVSPTGDDSRDGQSETSAFATPQRALAAAQPGDIVLLLDGTYERPADQPAKTPVARFVRPGSPAAWITLKNYPGHQPVLSAHGQTAVDITQPKPDPSRPDTLPKLSYLEVRGLRVRGNGDTAKDQHPAEIGTWSPLTNAQGIVVNGRFTPHPGERVPGEIVHHIRLADNVVEFCAGDGIYIEYGDWLFVENNRIENNGWTTIGYAPAGLAVMGYANFDAQDNVVKMLIARNRVSGNRLTVMNHPFGKKPKTAFFNGNGILLDANAEKPAKGAYLGRTLVQNNLVFNNGAGGIQMWASHRLDVVNNTVYQNGTVLRWGQIGFERCRDVRLINNIIVGRPDTPLDTWFARPDGGTADIVRLHNLYWGGVQPAIEGIADQVADPLFVNPTADPATADFRLRPDSPARQGGRWESFTPATDLDGRPRPAHTAPALGAFQL